MSYNGIEEAISQLYEIIQDARSVPLSSDKCMVERDQILDLLDEISNELPTSSSRPRRSSIPAARSSPAPSATPRPSASRPSRTPSVWPPRRRSTWKPRLRPEELVRSAENKVRELKQVTNEFVDDAPQEHRARHL